MFLLAFFIMKLIRVSLYLFYPDDFMDLTTLEVVQSFFIGFRVDIITLFTFSIPFVLLLMYIKNLYFRRWVGVLWGVVLLLIFIISFSNVLYFKFIHRHMSNEIFNLGDDFNIIISIALNSYLPYTLGALLFMIVFTIFSYKFFSLPIDTFVEREKLLIYSFVVILMLFFGIRGNISGKAFGTSDAFATNKISSGNLALNGVFAISRTAKNEQKHNLIDKQKGIAITREALTTPNAPFVDDNYPLLKSYKAKNNQKHNVVIVLLESWGAEHIDGFTKYKELNITPFFKELSNESLKFTNFYANGFRSIFGITSLFTGVTLSTGFEYLGRGLELSNLSYLGTIAKQNGYSTLAMQGGNRRSYRIDAISNLAGFDEYYGAEDIPNVEIIEKGRDARTGTYDHNLFTFYNQKISTLKEPFLTFAFTSTNHPDLYLPRAEFEKYPHDLNNYYGELNAYMYVDNAIKKFMENAKKEPWFPNTIFIFTADHGNGDALNEIGKKLRGDQEKLGSIEHYRIPLVIYAPKIYKPQEIATLGSQTDIFPTIVDMLGFEANITTLGTSLFDKEIEDRFVYYFAGNMIGLIKNDGYVVHNFKNVVEQKSISQEDINLLFAIDTAQAYLLEKNLWAK